jgi:hypothetical protein
MKNIKEIKNRLIEITKSAESENDNEDYYAHKYSLHDIDQDVIAVLEWILEINKEGATKVTYEDTSDPNKPKKFGSTDVRKQLEHNFNDEEMKRIIEEHFPELNNLEGGA